MHVFGKHNIGRVLQHVRDDHMHGSSEDGTIFREIGLSETFEIVDIVDDKYVCGEERILINEVWVDVGGFIFQDDRDIYYAVKAGLPNMSRNEAEAIAVLIDEKLKAL